jgi:hypothetical protein
LTTEEASAKSCEFVDNLKRRGVYEKERLNLDFVIDVVKKDPGSSLSI